MTDFVFSAQSPETRPPPPFLRAPATDEHALSVPYHADTSQIRDAMAVHSIQGSKKSKLRMENWMMEFVMNDDHYYESSSR